MALSNDLISQFVKVTNDDKKGPSESTVYGTIVEYDDKNYVRIDGSDYLTPADTTTDVEPGDRVLVTIKNHSATIIGNTSSPSVGSTTIEKVEGKLDSIEADTAVIGDLVADNVTIKDRLTANEAYISELEADNVTINGKLEAAEGSITKLETEKLDATAADIKYATIENLEATNADIYNLKSTFGDFQVLTTNELTAVKASIESLDVEYANIDFANIGEAAIENFYAKSGVIQDVVISDGQVTGTLAGVTIKGDLIEGGTIVADKLVVQGEDGLYYRLNTDGEKVTAQQTEYNSLSGTIITAKSVTAEKIAVDDLVAFDATIGGFSITEDSIYSGVKAGVNNTTRGVYLDNTGQVAFGDTNNYLKYYKDQNGDWKLEVSAQSVSFGSSGSKTNLEEFAADAIVSSVEEFYQSTSPISLVGGSWSTTQPIWTEGTYIWRRTAVTYGDGSSEYTPSPTGVCITGNTGAQGEKGDKGDDGEDGTGVTILGSYSTKQELESAHPTGNPGDSYIVDGDLYVWDETNSKWTNVGNIQGPQGIQGIQGEKGEQGIQGPKGDKGDTGATGKGISSVTNYYLATNSSSGVTTSTSGWTTTVQSVSSSKKYLWNYEKITYTDSLTSSTTPCIIGAYGDKGATGSKGDKGDTGAAGKGISSITEYYLASASASGVTTSTSGWTTTMQSTTTSKKYLWNYEKITYTDSSTSNTTTRIIGTHGATGATGAAGEDGNGIKSTSVTYQAGSSQTTAPTGTWSSAVPTLTTAKPYLWTRTIITYDDNTTSTSYSVSSTLESFEVGGRNLLRNTSYTGTGGYSERGDVYTISVDNSDDGLYNGRPSLKIVGTAAATSGSQDIWQVLWDNIMEDGRSVFLSFYAKGSVSTGMWHRVGGASIVDGCTSASSSLASDITTSWKRFTVPLGIAEQTDPDSTESAEVIYGFGAAGTFWINSMKLEYGNKATDWTPAPEDVDANLNDAIDNVNEDINAVDDRVAVAESLIQALNDTISMLVTDEDGTSLMTQTSTGWTYNMSTVTSNLDQVSNDLEALTEATGSTEAAVEELNKAVAEMGEISTYVNITTVNDQPCIELGASNSDFKVVITNTSIDFMEGTNTVAYINNNSLYITKAIIQEELQQGGFIWQIRSNGNLGLLWKGDE